MKQTSPSRRNSFLVSAALAAVLLIIVLFAPDERVATEGARLTTHSRDPGGARGLYETAARLRWSVGRHELPQFPPRSAERVYLSLAPPIPLTAAEAHELLERVRAGAGLFVVLDGGSPLADSLGVRFRGRYGRVPENPTAVCEPARRSRAAEALRGAPWASAFEVAPPGGAVVQSFLDLEGTGPRDASRMAAAGFALGAGRVGVVGDADVVQNSVFRLCGREAGVSLVRLLHFVSASDDGSRIRTRLLFDEYRHGFGAHPSISRATRRFLAEHPFGRMLAQLVLAGVLLAAAVGTLPASPAPPERGRRRSPLEHVRALALAYSAVSATRTATRLLVRGLRRRLRFTGSGRPGAGHSDREFLEHIAQRFPALAPEAGRVLAALERRVGRSELIAVGRSIETIERTIAGANH
jgi:hypothetical protein